VLARARKLFSEIENYFSSKSPTRGHTDRGSEVEHVARRVLLVRSPQEETMGTVTRHDRKPRNQTSSTTAQAGGLGVAHPNGSAPTPPPFPNQGPRDSRAVILGEHVAAALLVASEIEASASFEEDFGRSAPAKRPVVDGLTAADAWTKEAKRAEAWTSYALLQKELAWNAVMEGLAPVMTAFSGLAARDPTLAKRYPALAAFVGARHVAAKRAARVRKADAKREAKNGASHGAATPNGTAPNGTATNGAVTPVTTPPGHPLQ
jgi:hypothetical protein